MAMTTQPIYSQQGQPKGRWEHFFGFFNLKSNSSHSQWAVMKQMVNNKARIKQQFANMEPTIFPFVFCVPKKCQSTHYLSMPNSLRQISDA